MFNAAALIESAIGTIENTTVLIENVILLVCVGYASFKSRKAVLLICLFAVIAHMTFDNLLLLSLDIEVSNYDNMIYYWSMSFLFLGLFGMFLVRITKLSLVFAGCMLSQSFLSFLMAINGAELNGATLPEYGIIYSIHESFNAVIWIVECITVWVAMTTARK